MSGSEHYQHIFDNAKKLFDPSFIILLKKNDQPFARLGFIIGKKQVKKSSQRNAIKRVIRESFRYHQQLLQGYDVIVMARKHLAQINCKDLRQKLDKQWKKTQS